MRCFISIGITDEVKGKIRTLIDNMKHLSKGVRWVPIENIHLTLKFLGDVNENLIPEIKNRLIVLKNKYNPFKIDIKGTGAFPSPKYPNVLWIGVEPSDQLERLHLDIEDAMYEFGIKKEDRKFSPHLTIGRVKDRKEIDLVVKELYTIKDMFFGSIDIREFQLMRSILKPTGAEYFEIAKFTLEKNREEQ